MARFPRIVAIGIPHHVTQRGNAQRPVFETDSDRLAYLQLLGENCQTYELSIVGFCLMPNHVHLVVIPRQAYSMARALRHAHGRYAAYLNGRQGATGHVWQGRFYSCPLDPNHLWSALRYTELNPVRAGIVIDPIRYIWSSAAAHCSGAIGTSPLDLSLDTWRSCWDFASWRRFLEAVGQERDIRELRANTHTGRPLGSQEFVDSLERILERPLVPSPGGRPRKQQTLAFE